MKRLNIGDKVRVVSNISGEDYVGDLGWEGRIKGFGEGNLVTVCIEGKDCQYYKYQLRKLREYPPKFKAGDEVKVVFGGDKGREGVVVNPSCDPDPYTVVVRLREGCGDKARLVFLSEYDLEKVEEENMEYEVGKPYLWFGGQCPLPKGTSVAFRRGRDDFYYIDEYWLYEECAENVDWEHDYWSHNILMFKVMEYPKATRKVEMELTEEEITTIKEVLGKVNL